MDAVKYRFSDLNAVIDRVHALVDHWKTEGVFPSVFGDETLHMLRLAIHEWVANLVQHADFEDREPQILIDIIPNGRSVYCAIRDNSAGFDLDTNLRIRESMLESLPERGMGLLMIEACTEHLSYSRVDSGWHCLEFSVSADQNPWLHIPF
ncbi:ATP-binding protein [Rhodocaloribacter sp.]